ncbi:hypothetical protein MASR1M12_22690 [Erysipelotrichia bacterium]
MIDNHKLYYHPSRVAEWYEKGDCFPIYVEIGLTSRCNHQCVFCALDWLEQDAVDIDREVLLKALKDMADNGVKSLMFAGEGESLLHKDASLFIKYAADLGIKVAVTTNGVPFTPKRAEECLPSLSWIRFSCNAGTPEEYAMIHRTRAGDFERVLSNIRFAAEFKKKHRLNVDIGVQTLLLPQSVGSIVRLTELVKEAGADNFQVKPYSQHPSSENKLVLNNELYLELEPQIKAFESSNFSVIFRRNTIQRIVEGIDYDCCRGLPFFALVNAHGEIIPCNLFYANSDFIYGNLNNDSFVDIWKSERRKRVLALIREKDIKGCRQGCRLDAINRYLHRIKNPEERDSFI